MSVGPVPQDPAPATVTSLPRMKSETAAARLLGERLRNARIEKNLTLAQAAKIIRASTSKVSRLERGLHPPKERDVTDLVRFYDVTADEEAQILALLQQTRNSTWYHQYSDVTPTYLRQLIGLEGAARTIRTYENQVVPGLLQTPAYARAVVEAALPGAPDNDRRVKLRIGRQQLLRSPSRPQVVALLDEGILRRPVGGYHVMCAQLMHLIQAIEISDINIHIVEFEASALRSPTYPITHLLFDDGGPSEVVYVEHIDSAMYLTRPTDVERYRHVLSELAFVAARRERSKEILRDAVDRYRRKIRAMESDPDAHLDAD
ncbi:helix-turn-helix domain-containing protein [Streptomyces sp. NPDC012637]|uniref:helix-turn-helix domain-containing protein n=1 Tax=unclassified Streptomyces TaxID=2593676 RepID=UPI00365BF060